METPIQEKIKMDRLIQKKRELTELLTGFSEIPLKRGHVPINFVYDNKVGNIFVRKVSYDSLPYATYKTQKNGEVSLETITENIPAYILIPDFQNGKGIVALHQHAMEYDLGKSEPAGLKAGKCGPDFTYGKELAERGYTVLCFDFKTFEERQYTHSSLQAHFSERFAKQEAVLDGIELMGVNVLDVMQSMTILSQEGITDIGLIGHSLGATVAAYALAMDTRIKTAVANCGVASFDSVRKALRVQGWHWAIHGIKPTFGELHNITPLMGTRPFLISAAKQDKCFPIEGVNDFVVWSQYAGGKPQLYQFDGGHSFPRHVRENAYHFLEENL